MLKGMLELVKNKKRKWNENIDYLRLVVSLDDSLINKYQMKEMKLLFTKRELLHAYNRALKNKEDFEEVKNHSLWDQVVDYIFGGNE